MGRDAGRALQGGAAPFGGVHGATWTSASGPRSAREVTGRQGGHSGPPPDTRPGHRGQSAETAAKFEPRSPHSGADRRRPESVPAGFPSPAPCSTCCYPWPSGSERRLRTGSGSAWTAPRQRAEPGAGRPRWTASRYRPSGTSWPTTTATSARPPVPSKQAGLPSGPSGTRPTRANTTRPDTAVALSQKLDASVTLQRSLCNRRILLYSSGRGSPA